MAEYLLAVHIVEGVEPEAAELAETYADVDVFNKELQEQGAWVFGGGLHPSSSATVVRVEGERVITTDGPYAETKEQLGGFWVVNAPDLDAALALARRATRACRAPVEVRPFQGGEEG